MIGNKFQVTGNQFLVEGNKLQVVVNIFFPFLLEFPSTFASGGQGEDAWRMAHGA
ncbi:MAG: hypothetical protein JSV88_19825 [Candidatus Aminicenantes bacterium]|nr:MAG: hypothetical protein JSV88_19825 [Candidatus Aminicenantes bacterium]